jgi:hypothetical protein
VLHRVFGRIGEGRMSDFVERETFTGILDAAHYHLARADIGYLDVLLRIEMPPVLDRVEQHLAEGDPDLAFFTLGEIRDFAQENEQPVPGPNITTDGEAD